jgi:hypothetical protein
MPLVVHLHLVINQVDKEAAGRQRDRGILSADHHDRSHTPSYNKGIIIFIYCLIFFLIYVLDITMDSPPKAVPAYGSSCSTGGVFRGCVSGNTFNIGDAAAVRDDINRYNHSDGEPKKGKIYLYISDLNPATVDISQLSFITNVYDTSKCQNIQDVVKRGSRDYSPICSMLFFF